MTGKSSDSRDPSKQRDRELRPQIWVCPSDMATIAHAEDVLSRFARGIGFPWVSFASHQPVSFNKREATTLTNYRSDMTRLYQQYGLHQSDPVREATKARFAYCWDQESIGDTPYYRHMASLEICAGIVIPVQSLSKSIWVLHLSGRELPQDIARRVGEAYGFIHEFGYLYDELVPNHRRRPLTERQREVLTLLTQGKSQKEVAKIVDLHPSTIRDIIMRLQKKLNANTPFEAKMTAIMLGLIAD